MKYSNEVRAIFFFLVSVLIFFFSVQFAHADSYTRTPGSTNINFGTNVNVSGEFTSASNTDSYKIRVKDIDGTNTVYSPCRDINSDEIIYNEDFPSLAVGGYDYVHLFYYYGDNECADDANSQILESNAGEETFFIVTVPVVTGCTDPLAENFDPDATEDDGSCTYVLTTSIFIGALLLSLLICMFVGIIIENLSKLIATKLQ